MKKILKIKLVLLLCYSIVLSAQVTVKKLNDPSIVAQEKRMVFESWGNWKPDPKYILGIQTNFAYATVWGLWAPKINRDYKGSTDFRPLKPDGIEVKRLAELELQRKDAEKINAENDSIYKRNVQDFAHWTSATVDADPLWLLYYKRMLRPLKDFPEDPQNFQQWKLKDDETYQKMLSNGAIDFLKKQLDLLKDKYNVSRTIDMPRGKRFLLYHETLIGWRNFMNKLEITSKQNSLFLDYKKMLMSFNIENQQLTTSRTDKQIVESVMLDCKNKF